MNIVADENIPFAVEAFGGLGRVRLVNGRSMSAADVSDADLLLVRSVTKVGAELLDGSPVRFVGTTTIGTDHVDEAYLRGRGIAFASAPGSNANSVAEYVTAALLVVAERLGRYLEDMTLGVVGVGNVGSLVVAKAEALGMVVVQNDPPLRRATGDARFRPIEELFERSDIITLHVPLTMEGIDATYAMVDEAFIERMVPGAVLVNTSRGSVVREDALKAALAAKRLSAAVLDVWQNEPDIDLDLLRLVEIGTPHIAGYSFDGKVEATLMLYRAACRLLGRQPDWSPVALMPPPEHSVITPAASLGQTAVMQAVTCAYDILRDDRRLRAVEDEKPAYRGLHFDLLRKRYPIRREFDSYTVRCHRNPNLKSKLEALGFATE